MKLLILVPFLLIYGCEDHQRSIYKIAKSNPNTELCYNISGRGLIDGRYCTYYKGPEK